MPEMKHYLSKARGLKLVYIRSVREWNPDARKYDITPAEYIKFVDGRFATDDPKKQEFLEKKIEKSSKTIVCVSEKQKLMAEKSKEIEAAVEREMGMKKRKKGSQGAVGTT